MTLTPFEFEDDISEREDTFMTNGLFFVEYRVIRNGVVGRSPRPFLLRGDAYDIYRPCRVSSWEGFVEFSSQNAVLSFLLKYTNVSEDTFRIAQDNPFAQIPFCLDVPRYCRDLGSEVLYTKADIGRMMEYSKTKKANAQLVYNRAMNDLNLLTGKKEED